jgi:hypothetical protein
MRWLTALLCLVAAPALADECRYVSSAHETIVVNDGAKTFAVDRIKGDDPTCRIVATKTLECNGDAVPYFISPLGDLYFWNIIWHRTACRTPV